VSGREGGGEKSGSKHEGNEAFHRQVLLIFCRYGQDMEAAEKLCGEKNGNFFFFFCYVDGEMQLLGDAR
jgi:hypothetical protein